MRKKRPSRDRFGDTYILSWVVVKRRFGSVAATPEILTRRTIYPGDGVAESTLEEIENCIRDSDLSLKPRLRYISWMTKVFCVNYVLTRILECLH